MASAAREAFGAIESRVKSLLVLVSGSLAGHGITAATMPFLTRIYSPEHFQIFASFNAFTAILSVLITFRYEFAIPIAKSRSEANHILIGVFFLGCLMSIVLTLASVLFLPTFNTLTKWPGENLVLFHFCASAALLIGLNLSLIQWRTYQNAYTKISKSRILQSSSVSSIQLLLSRSVISDIGLVVGHFGGVLSSAVYLSSELFTRAPRVYCARSSLLRSYAYLKKHWRFPKYSVPEAFFNVLSIQLPIILIASSPEGVNAGLMALAMYMLQIPLLLLGTSFGQLYLGEGGKALPDEQLKSLTLDVVGRMSALITIPFLILGLFAPEVFSLIFGEEWARAGYFAVILLPCFFFQALSSPISTILYMHDLQALATKLQFFGCVLRVGSVLFFLNSGGAFLVEAYAVSGFLHYTLCYFVYMRVAGVAAIQRIAALMTHNWILNIAVAIGLVFLSMITSGG